MKIKRQPRKIDMHRASVKTGAPVKKDIPKKKLGFGKYRLPRTDEVPPGLYYSVIAHIEETLTRAGNEAIAVFYDIAKFSDVYRKVNGLRQCGEVLKVLYIKQIYPTNSEPYRSFLESMYDALGLDYEDDIDLNDCIGVQEAISLAYGSVSGIGGIQKRFPVDEEYFIELYKESNIVVASSDERSDVECDEYGNHI